MVMVMVASHFILIIKFFFFFENILIIKLQVGRKPNIGGHSKIQSPNPYNMLESCDQNQIHTCVNLIN